VKYLEPYISLDLLAPSLVTQELLFVVASVHNKYFLLACAKNSLLKKKLKNALQKGRF